LSSENVNILISSLATASLSTLAIGSPVSLFQLAYSKTAYLMIMKLLYISKILIIGFEQRFKERFVLLCSEQSIAPYLKAETEIELKREAP
jgi:hypothetical protein